MCTNEGERKEKGALKDLVSYYHLGQSSRTPTLLSLRVALNLPNTPLVVQAQDVSKYNREEGK